MPQGGDPPGPVRSQLEGNGPDEAVHAVQERSGSSGLLCANAQRPVSPALGEHAGGQKPGVHHRRGGHIDKHRRILFPIAFFLERSRKQRKIRQMFLHLV